jgi:hypothetical protein
MPQPTEFETEQKIFLGGQISYKHKEFMDFALYDPDTAFVIWFVENYDRLEKLNDDEATVEILKVIGKLELIRYSSELTRLSMIMGDTRKRYSVRGVMDKLRHAQSNPTT